MTGNRPKYILLITSFLLLTACATEPNMRLKPEDVQFAEDHPVKSYTKNRLNDALDIFSLSLETGVFGAQAIISRWNVGLFLADIPGIEGKGGVGFGLSYDEKVTGYGLRGGRFGKYRSGEMTLLVGQYHFLESKSDDLGEKDYYYRFKGGWAHDGYPPTIYTRIGFSLGLIVGIHFEFNPGELLDFLLGFFGIDIYSDDRYRVPTKADIANSRNSGDKKNTNIWIRNAGMEKYSESLCLFDQVEHIYVNGNRIRSFPDACAGYKRLTLLDAAENLLEEIPAFLYKLKTVEILNLHTNQIREIKTEIGQMESLKDLALGGNQLTKLPEEMGKLKNLEQLDLRWNQIQHLPDSLKNLKKLKLLEIGGNSVPQSEIDALQKALPKLKIKTDPNS